MLFLICGICHNLLTGDRICIFWGYFFLQVSPEVTQKYRDEQPRQHQMNDECYYCEENHGSPSHSLVVIIHRFCPPFIFK